MTDEEPKAKSTGLSTRGAVLVGVGVVGILLLAVPTAILVGSIRETQGVLRDFDHTADSEREFVDRLGGPEKALPRLRLYIRLPNGIAPHEPIAVRLLGACGPRAVNTLIPALGDGDARIRFHAADAVRRIGPSAHEAVPALIPLLEDPDAGIRETTAEALGRIGLHSRAAVPALIRHLQDPEQGVRRAAAEGLGGVGRDAAQAAPALIRLMNDSSSHTIPRHTAVRVLAQIGAEEEVVPALIKAVRERLEDDDVGFFALQSLARIGPPAVPHLVKRLEDDDRDIRGMSAGVLGEIGPAAKDALPALERLLHEEEEWVRSVAKEALKKIRGEEE